MSERKSCSWCNLVKEDFQKISMHMTDVQIENMPETDYKRLIRNKTREAAFVYLHSLKWNLKNPQKYIRSKILTNVEKSIWFGLRSETIGGIKMNFLCPICERSPDSQEHLPLCPLLQSILPLEKHIEYSLIHGSVEQQKEYVEVYKRYLEIPDELMDSSGGASLQHGFSIGVTSSSDHFSEPNLIQTATKIRKIYFF